MTLAQRYIAWGTGILLWIFGLSILLSYFAFGYLDFDIIAHMARILSPILVVAVFLLYLFREPINSEQPQEAPHVSRRMTEVTR